MRKLTLLSLFMLLSAATAYCQDSGGELRHKLPAEKSPTGKYRRVPDALPFRESAYEIKAMRPEVSDRTLYYDMSAVMDARPVVRDVFRKRGFLWREADDALMYGWEQLRITRLKPTETLSPEVLVRYVSGYGKVIIRTKPAGATVIIDGKTLPDKTEAVSWSSDGRHPIKLRMEGYESVEDTCAAEEGKTTFFERTLKPVKHKPGTSVRKRN